MTRSATNFQHKQKIRIWKEGATCDRGHAKSKFTVEHPGSLIAGNSGQKLGKEELDFNGKCTRANYDTPGHRWAKSECTEKRPKHNTEGTPHLGEERWRSQTEECRVT